MKITGIGKAVGMIAAALVFSLLLLLLFAPLKAEGRLRLSPLCARAVFSLYLGPLRVFTKPVEADLFQEPYLALSLLRNDGERIWLRLPKQKKKKNGKLRELPLRLLSLDGALYIGVKEDGALTAQLLGAAYVLLENFSKCFFERVRLQPVPCFDKNICRINLDGIASFNLAESIFVYLKRKKE